MPEDDNLPDSPTNRELAKRRLLTTDIIKCDMCPAQHSLAVKELTHLREKWGTFVTKTPGFRCPECLEEYRCTPEIAEQLESYLARLPKCH